MIAQATPNLVDVTSLPASVLDVSAESLISAYSYKNVADRQLGTAGGPSWAFGENGFTLSFMPMDEINNLRQVLDQILVREKNRRAIKLLEKWFAEPDDLGEDFWAEFDRELEANRFSIP